MLSIVLQCASGRLDGSAKNVKVVDYRVRVHREKPVILVREVRVFDNIHLLRAPQPVRKQPDFIAEAVETGDHQIRRRHVRQVRSQQRRHMQISEKCDVTQSKFL